MRIVTIIENTISAILFLVGITVSLYSVFMRYVIGSSQSWATEVYTMMLVWAIFIGFSTALRDDKHISINLIYDRVGPRLKKLFEVITLLVGIAFSIFFVWTGLDMVLTAKTQDIKTIDTGFPIWIYYIIMPVAGVFLLIRFLEKGVQFIRGKNNTADQEVDS